MKQKVTNRKIDNEFEELTDNINTRNQPRMTQTKHLSKDQIGSVHYFLRALNPNPLRKERLICNEGIY
jgi:hypothetical protein